MEHLENVLENAENIKGAMGEKVEEGKEIGDSFKKTGDDHYQCSRRIS